MAELRAEIKKDIEYLVNKIRRIRSSSSPLLQAPVPQELYQQLGQLQYALQTSSQKVLSTIVENYSSLENCEIK